MHVPFRSGLLPLARCSHSPPPRWHKPQQPIPPSRSASSFPSPWRHVGRARAAIGQKLSESWKQSVVVDNKPGAGGNIGAELVAKAEPDGYTLLLLDVGTLTISPSIYAKLGYDPVKDLAPITMVAVSPHALVVHPSIPANSVKELIAWPGQSGQDQFRLGGQWHRCASGR